MKKLLLEYIYIYIYVIQYECMHVRLYIYIYETCYDIKFSFYYHDYFVLDAKKSYTNSKHLRSYSSLSPNQEL